MTTFVVFGAWAGVIASDIWYIAHYGIVTPYWDDWNLIPFAAGRQPITWEWLWAFEADHRVPVPKLLFVGLYRLGRGDVRINMLVNLLIVGAISLLGIMVARRRRGYTRFSDLLIPLALAGIANYSNLVSANQVQYISAIGLFCLAVCLILWQPDWFRMPTVALLGVCVVALPLTGSTGVALAVPLVGLLAWGTYVTRHSLDAAKRRTSWTAAVLCSLSIALLVTYSAFGDRPVSPVLAPAAGLRQFADATLQLTAVGFTAPPLISQPSAASDWPQRLWRARAALVVAAGSIAALGLLLEVRRRRATLTCVLGPLACLASVALLALVIGLERGAALEQRYIILGATLLFTVYMCLILLRHHVATLAGWALAILALVLLPWNASYAIGFGQARQTFEANLERDIRAGTPVDLLGTRYYPEIWGDPVLAASAIREMRDDHIGPFVKDEVHLNDAPPVVATEKTLSPQPAAVHNMTQVGDYWQGTGGDSFLVYAIKQPNVAGVRLTYELANSTERPAYLQLAWSNAPEGSFDTTGNTFVVWGAATTNQQEQLVAWIGQTVDMLKITPDTQAASFKLDSLVLLLSQ